MAAERSELVPRRPSGGIAGTGNGVVEIDLPTIEQGERRAKRRDSKTPGRAGTWMPNAKHAPPQRRSARQETPSR